MGSRAEIESSTVVPMFPCLVWKAQLKREFHEPLDRAILAKLAAMHEGRLALAGGQSWQSAVDLHRLAELAPLVAVIEGVAGAILEFLRVRTASLGLTGCWANVNAPGAAHRMHAHPNNFLSGVYYVQAPAGADSINFHDPRPQTAIIRPPVTELTAENTDQVVLPVRDGTLLLFAAWLPHSVDPNRSDRMRISVSFNLMFGAFTESLAKPLWGDSER